MNNQNWRIPLSTNKCGELANERCATAFRFIPVWSAQIPVYKPHFSVPNIVAPNWNIPSWAMKALNRFSWWQPANIPKIRRSWRPHSPVCPYPHKFFSYVINSRKIIFHVLAAIIAADLFEPFFSEAWQTTRLGATTMYPLATICCKFQRYDQNWLTVDWGPPSQNKMVGYFLFGSKWGG